MQEDGAPDELGSTVARWLAGLRAGDDDAAADLWQRYFQRLVAVADRRLGGEVRRTYDEEDVALSAFHSLCRGVRAGRFPDVQRDDELWSLLVVIAARKVARRARANNTLKRGGAAEVADAELVAGIEPTPEFALELADEAEHLQSLLPPELRELAALKLEGYTNEEIARRLDCALRTVERRVALIRRTWSERGDL